MKVTFLTLGCRVNQAESAVLEGTLKDNGVSIVNLSDNPDYCVINTCAVTAKSDYNSRQLIRRAAKTGAKVIVTGCYSELKRGLVNGMPGVTAVIDISRKDEIVSAVFGSRSELSFGSQRKSRPYLKIQDGCNLRCSYCSVPLARGRSRSVFPDEVIRRAQVIESKGFNEIVLTGVHLGAYGHDLEVTANLSIILKQLLLKTTISRIRLSSLAVSEIDDSLLELLQENRVCNHLHIPLQSGSDKILGLMRRTYTRSAFASRVTQVVSRIENIALGTDVIIGFPQEGDLEFSETLALLSDLPFSYLHVFPFSPRENTAAARMLNRPPHDTVVLRANRMKELHKQLKARYMSEQLGRELDVILEDEADNRLTGTSGNYIKVAVETGSYRKGELVSVRVTGICGDMLEGTLIHHI
jgi:threonylcarbamoyladenosine tRNA methylthiotransferase MtaB